ncbi:MarR family winged helix-turn-helix transcriptional regulator [Streptomyces aureocirculatus]|uniref:MarR family winged helix-turn-helix transcriptional regulator n=1 Tax=Streptomyces aureocirculatus TaxID=67275 RepID=UPI0004C7AE2C|nr:MarR family transcriptional regulator [Streptomyces aureocirculatus]
MSTPEDASKIYRQYLSAVMLHGHAGAKACHLGATDLYALNILELSGAMTPGELGTRTGLTTGPTTRLIDRLEAAGYVRRAPSPDDRRKVIIEPIDRPGRLDEVLAPARRAIGAIIGDYSPEEREVLFDYFVRATRAYQDSTENLNEPP